MIKSLLIPLRVSTLASILEDLESSLEEAIKLLPIGDVAKVGNNSKIGELKEQINLVKFQIQTIL